MRHLGRLRVLASVLAAGALGGGLLLGGTAAADEPVPTSEIVDVVSSAPSPESAASVSADPTPLEVSDPAPTTVVVGPAVSGDATTTRVEWPGSTQIIDGETGPVTVVLGPAVSQVVNTVAEVQPVPAPVEQAPAISPPAAPVPAAAEEPIAPASAAGVAVEIPAEIPVVDTPDVPVVDPVPVADLPAAPVARAETTSAAAVEVAPETTSVVLSSGTTDNTHALVVGSTVTAGLAGLLVLGGAVLRRRQH